MNIPLLSPVLLGVALIAGSRTVQTPSVPGALAQPTVLSVRGATYPLNFHLSPAEATVHLY